MYKLTLTESERQAIDWVGHRYTMGYDTWKILYGCMSDEQIDDDVSFPCFSPDFETKLRNFVSKIV